MRPNLITRLKEEWNNLDPVDPLRGLIADAIDALAEQPAQHTEPCGWRMKHNGEWAYSFTEDAWDFIRIAQPAQPAQQQEPFGYFKPEPFGWTDCAETDEGAIALYDRPPASKPWVGLTDEEINTLDQWLFDQPFWRVIALARAIEAKLREKNGG